jgi:hypothetical protein
LRACESVTAMSTKMNAIALPINTSSTCRLVNKPLGKARKSNKPHNCDKPREVPTVDHVCPY